MADELANTLIKRLGSLKSQRSTWESHWQEIADFVVPRKADVTKVRSAGDKRSELVFDGTAIHAAELLSSSLHGMLTNGSTSWFSLRYSNEELNSDDEAMEWLQGVEDVMYKAFNRSNFQEQIHELYIDLVTFGTGVMFVEADQEQQLRFSTRHIKECFLSEDEKGRVDTVFREFKMPVRAALKRFDGADFGSKILKKAEKDPYEMIKLVHCVFQRDDRDITKINSQNKPFASIYVEPEEKIVLGESGFDEFPYCAPRYSKSSSEIGYGRSPSMTALSDIKMLNRMCEVTIRAAQKQVDPPLLVPDDGFLLPVRTVPGGLNFYRSGTRDRIEPLNIGANNPLGLNMEEQRRQAIRSAFYVDQLILGTGPQMTATEVVQRTQEKMKLLGPLTGRLSQELLQPLITRSYNILERQRAFKPAPESMQGIDLEIEYVSPLAKAQRQGDIQDMTRLLELMAPLSQLNPEIMDYIDADGISKHLIKILGVPATAVRGDREVAMMREEKAEAQQAAAEQQELMQGAEAAGNAAPMLRALQGQGQPG